MACFIYVMVLGQMNKKKETCLKYIKKLLKFKDVDPNFYNTALLFAGVIFESLEEPLKAIRYLKMSLKFNRKNHDTYYTLGSCHWKLG